MVKIEKSLKKLGQTYPDLAQEAYKKAVDALEALPNVPYLEILQAFKDLEEQGLAIEIEPGVWKPTGRGARGRIELD